MALKELEAKYAKPRGKPYKLTDGEGLYLLVQPNGSKLWRMKYRAGGKEKLLSFGRYPDVGLATAREKRLAARQIIAAGGDPMAEERPKCAEQSLAFESIARAWHANRADSLDPNHSARVMARFERDVFPAMGRRVITDIKPTEVLEMIRKVEARGALDISKRLKQGVGQVFRFAIANGWAETDPTGPLLGALKPKPRVQHMARIPFSEFPDFVRAIETYDGEPDSRRREITKKALLFTLLTWARTRETRLACWCEFDDLDGAEPLWRIPAERMKMGREHLVPLSQQAAALLRALRDVSGSAFVFPGQKPLSPISENTMIYACYRMGYRGRQTVHGFRGLASTWANEAERYSSDWIEMALAHADEDEVRGAYNSALYLGARRRMLQDWADEVSAAGVAVRRDGISRRREQIGSASSRVTATITTRSPIDRESVVSRVWRRR